MEKEPEQAPILKIDKNPENSVVTSPDGRVFVNMMPMIADLTNRLITETLTAVMSGTDEDRAYVRGKLDIVQHLNNTQKDLEMQARLERELSPVEGIDKDGQA